MTLILAPNKRYERQVRHEDAHVIAAYHDAKLYRVYSVPQPPPSTLGWPSRDLVARPADRETPATEPEYRRERI